MMRIWLWSLLMASSALAAPSEDDLRLRLRALAQQASADKADAIVSVGFSGDPLDTCAGKRAYDVDTVRQMVARARSRARESIPKDVPALRDYVDTKLNIPVQSDGPDHCFPSTPVVQPSTYEKIRSAIRDLFTHLAGLDPLLVNLQAKSSPSGALVEIVPERGQAPPRQVSTNGIVDHLWRGLYRVSFTLPSYGHCERHINLVDSSQTTIDCQLKKSGALCVCSQP